MRETKVMGIPPLLSLCALWRDSIDRLLFVTRQFYVNNSNIQTRTADWGHVDRARQPGYWVTQASTSGAEHRLPAPSAYITV